MQCKLLLSGHIVTTKTSPKSVCGRPPDLIGGAYDFPLDPLVGWRGDIFSPFPTPLTSSAPCSPILYPSTNLYKSVPMHWATGCSVCPWLSQLSVVSSQLPLCGQLVRYSRVFHSAIYRICPSCLSLFSLIMSSSLHKPIFSYIKPVFFLISSFHFVFP